MSDNAFRYDDAANQYSPTERHTNLADQYFETVGRSSRLGPEKSLTIALLEDAVTCFQDNIFAKSPGAKLLLQDSWADVRKKLIQFGQDFNASKSISPMRKLTSANIPLTDRDWERV